MRRLSLAATATAMLFIPAAYAQSVDVTFIVVNDTDKIDISGRGGFARLAGAIAAERAERDNVVVLHAGDAISPSLLSSIDKGRHAIDLLNQVGLDVFVPGNHEFDFGPEIFRERMAELTVPKLVANVSEADGSALEGFAGSTTMRFGSITVGIVGLTSDDATVKSSPGDLQFEDMISALTREADALSADYVVAVAHASRSQDMAIVDSRAADMVLSGDDHDLTVFYDGRTVYAEAREQAAYLPAIDVTFTVEGEGDDREVEADYGFRVIDTADVTPDATVLAALEAYNGELDQELDVQIGSTTVPLDSRRASVRGGETALGNLIADAMRAQVGADIAITNGGGIRGDKEYDAGVALSRRDVLTELPFGNATVLYELTGADIVAALENGVSRVEDGSGRFPHVSGISVEVDLSQPAGQRVVRVAVGGEPLDDAKTYRVATNDFMARGGDGYTAFLDGTPVIDAASGDLMANGVMAHIEGQGEVAPQVDGRMTLRR